MIKFKIVRDFIQYVSLIKQLIRLILTNKINNKLDADFQEINEIDWDFTGDVEPTEITYLPGYFLGDMTILVEYLILKGFLNRKNKVEMVSSTLISKNHCVLFGGNYGKFRRTKRYIHYFTERAVAKSLGLKLTRLKPNTNKIVLIKFRLDLWKKNINELVDIIYQDLRIGKWAEYATVNLLDQNILLNTRKCKRHMINHILDQIKLADAWEKYEGFNKNSTVFSNVAFYYNWRIPHTKFKLNTGSKNPCQ